VDLLYFVLFVSILIFIHELGHFVAAKIFGVKVLTFSIGFGPKILRVRGKETEYCLGILPFGGFVKMLEKGKGEPILPEDAPRTFEAQALWKRVVIVLAGPAMNILFPVLLYVSVSIGDREFLPPTVGVVLPGKAAEGKLHPDDVILAVDGANVATSYDLQRAVAKKAGIPVVLRVLRDGKTIEVPVTPTREVRQLEPPELDLVESYGAIGVGHHFPAPVIGIPSPTSPAYRAGLRTFDRVTAVNGRKVDRFVDLARMLSQSRGDTLVVTYLRPVSARTMGGLADLAVLEPGVATLSPLTREEDAKIEDQPAREKDMLARTGIESADLFVAFVPEGSSEWRAGLRPGDRVLTLDGAPVRNWKAMEGDLLRGGSRMRTLEWARAGERLRGELQVRQEQWTDELGQPYERYVFRTTHWLPSAPDKMVPNPSPYFYAVRAGFEETRDALRVTVVILLRLFQGRVSLSQVSGPITLYDVAGQAGAMGTSYFVRAIAITSINLGLINLLPIPVLDGGHLALFLIEAVRRRPISLRAREIASLIGMFVLVTLMAIAFKNDVARKWDVIRGHVRELTAQSP
jgi:regulator of sigma E protease